MLIHNLKISVRSFQRHRLPFFVNLIGLVGGLTTALFIFTWVNYELSVDKFHNEEASIYRLVSDNGGNATLLNTSPRYARELESSIPEITYIVNSIWGALESNLIVEEQVFSTVGEFGSERFFELFNYPLIHGNPTEVLRGPNAIVLSESTAFKLFNTTDVVGNKLEWRWYSISEPAVVSGVFKDPPGNSSVQFDYVLSFNLYEKRFKNQVERGRNGRTYLKIAEGANAEIVNRKIREHTRTNYPDYEGRPYMIIKYSDYYLHGIYENGKPVGGRIELVRLFVLIGALVLIIACFNFMNLSTAQAALRAKEIGVRKTMGAIRKSLISQYLTESCLICLVAGSISIGLLFLLFPFFQELLGNSIARPSDPLLILSFIGIILITGLLSGSYPALYLSRLNSLVVLKGTFNTSKRDQWFRKGLVVFQFGSSLMLIIAVLVIYRQMVFIQSKGLGYQKEHILNFETKGMTGEKQQAFLSAARNIHGISKAAGISHALFGAQKSGANMSWTGKDPDQEIWFEWGYVGYDMLELLEVDLHEGRFFSRDYGNEREKVVINLATKKLMGNQSVLGKKFTVGDHAYEIIGVTEDFHFQSLHEAIKPTFFLLNDHWSMKIALRIPPEKLSETLPEVQQLYAAFNPGFPFEYSFHDQDQLQEYQTEQKVTVLSRYAALLAILISCLGLFGLTRFIAERKAKEMSIRKVLGAPMRSLLMVFSKDFGWPLVAAFAIGSAGSVILLNQWLDQFAYHIRLQGWYFAIAIFLVLLLAGLTSLAQVLKTLSANPIEDLKEE